MQVNSTQGKIMPNQKFFCRTVGLCLAAIIILPLQLLSAETSSDADRLAKLEQAVAQLQKRNAELEKEVSSLKKQAAVASQPAAEGRTKTQITSDGKTYVEKNVAPEEKPPAYVVQRGSEINLTLGGFIQVNFEDGDVSAFEGRFGQTAIKDRFRLRRARINLTGDFAEQFDFKMEGDFGQSDGTSGNRTAFSATDIWVNWHQIPALQVKVGQYKAPFGLEQLTPDTSLLTIERTLPTGAITPDRQTGAELWGKPFTSIWPEQTDLLTYYDGIFNVNARNITVNDTNYVMFASRLDLQPFK